jgi:hypothetical protein
MSCVKVSSIKIMIMVAKISVLVIVQLVLKEDGLTYFEMRRSALINKFI